MSFLNLVEPFCNTSDVSVCVCVCMRACVCVRVYTNICTHIHMTYCKKSSTIHHELVQEWFQPIGQSNRASVSVNHVFTMAMN